MDLGELSENFENMLTIYRPLLGDGHSPPVGLLIG